jgi:dTDP-4-amino-4,6-dideoxygalactose transaminase
MTFAPTQAESRADAGTIPLVDLRAQYDSIQADVAAAVDRVLERQAFVGGPESTAFEREFADFCGVEECVALSNGTTALELTLQALGVGPGDEVVTVSHTFVATVSAIVRTGATPVFLDVDERTWTMTPESLAESVRRRTKAIVPVHIYGHPADVPALAAAAPGVPIVEDAAQAHGAHYHDSPVGSASTAACFSFYPGKNLGAYGDAGAVVTRDPALADVLRSLRDHGRAGGRYVHRVFGTNARMADLQAAVLRVKLPRLRAWTRARQELSALYEAGLDGAGVRVQTVAPWANHARHLFVLLHPERDRLLQELRRRGIEAGVHYPVPVHRQPAIAGVRHVVPGHGLPVTEEVAATCLSLPLYPELGETGVRRVLDAVRRGLPAAAAA